MKLYTLKYDCNRPTKQQINIPTNTDYKVGVKVVRNGKQSGLLPTEVMLDTLSADNNKLNGYVTFTESAGDTPSYVQKTIQINKGYDATYEQGPIVYSKPGTSVTMLSADLTPYAGMELAAKDLYLYGEKRRSAITEDAVLSGLSEYWHLPTTMQAVMLNGALVYGANGIAKIFAYVDDGVKAEIIETLGWNPDVPGFFICSDDGTSVEKIQETYTIQAGDILYIGKNFNVGNDYGGAMVRFTIGDPYSATFELVENTFKSQVGDQSVGLQSASTVKLTGEFADGADFSYDIVAK